MPNKPHTSRPLLLTLASRFILVAFIPVLMIALLFRFYYEPLMRADIETRQLRAAEATAQQIAHHFSIAERELAALGDLFASAPHLGQEQTEVLLDAYADSSNFYEALYLTDEQGQIRAIGLASNRRLLRQNLQGLDMSARDFVRSAHRLRQGFWSNSFLSTVSSRLTVALAQPVGLRTLIGEVAIEPLPTLVRQLSQNSQLQIRLLDRQNQLVASSESVQAGQQLNLGNLSVLQRSNGQSSRFELDGQALIGVAHKVEGPDWQVLVAQPEANAYGQINTTWQRIMLSLGLALVVALAIAGATSWTLAQKISQFSEHVSAIAQGSYDLELEDSDIRELNTLRHSLEQMVGAIVEREHGMARTALSLRESEDRLLATLENTPNVAVQWFDPEGRVLLWNHASETLYGIARQDALGKTLDQLFLNPQQARLFLATLREAAKGVALGPYLSDVRNAAGQQLYVQGTTFSIPAPGGGKHFVCMNVDITEQKKAELAYRDLNETLEQRVVLRTDALTQSNLELNQTLATLQQAQNELVRSEKLAALGSLVAGIAHELNTPIGNSVMAASTLEDHSKAMSQAVTTGNLRRSMLEQFINDTQTATDILMRNLRRASELISSFKQVAADQASAQRRQFNLAEAVNEILITLGPTLKKTPYQIDSEIDASIVLDSYPGALGQILVNLINNALLHAFDGASQGLISVKAFATEPGWIDLTITDNGHGISEEDLPRIFDPFFTTKLGQGGSGLGLNIVHNLATGVLGGNIAVASQLDWGTRFILSLPLVAPNTTASAEHSPAPAITSSFLRPPGPDDASS
ncbi:MAG: PAS domain S-box protein [Pseudomonadales bacterium]|nr:PAS domain S-box protein [Pseudomonadales bacterium]